VPTWGRERRAERLAQAALVVEAAGPRHRGRPHGQIDLALDHPLVAALLFFGADLKQIVLENREHVAFLADALGQGAPLCFRRGNALLELIEPLTGSIHALRGFAVLHGFTPEEICGAGVLELLQ
jgi:hypothetical protein